MIPLFKNGIQGLSDTLWSGVAGSASKIVGIDHRTKPGTFMAQQKLAKDSSTTIDELCKEAVYVSDGSTLWFSSESGKIWREVSGTYTLVHTTVPTDGEAKCLGASQLNDFIIWATENYLHKIEVSLIGGDWSEEAEENFGEFEVGNDEFHTMIIQRNNLFIADGHIMTELSGGNIIKDPTKTMEVEFDPDVNFAMSGVGLRPSGDAFPEIVEEYRTTSASETTSFSQNITVGAGDNKAIYVFFSSFRDDGTAPDLPATLDFDGQTISGSFSSSGAVGPPGENRRFEIHGYVLTNPTEKTADIVATLNQTETNLVMHTLVLSGVDQTLIPDAGTLKTDSSDDVSSSGSITFDFEGADYILRLLHVRSETTDQTFPSPQEEIFNANNDYGTDSLTYIGKTDDLDFISETGFEVDTQETIQALIDFDVDVLVGTRKLNKGRVLRWDALSPQWSASDEIDDEGINSFIRDDNYVYVNTGFYGRLYFYNGEQMEPFKRIPGDWSPTAGAKINSRSVGFHLGIPVFGLSSETGNPALQGVYGFGSYSRDYPKTLSLDFPVPSGEFEGVEIGAILTSGTDLYVAWKDSEDVGVAKLDWSNKYESAYLETPALIPPEERSNFSLINAFNVDYVELPASTDVSIGIKKRYEASFTDLHTNNFTELQQIKSRVTATRIANLIIRIGLTVNENNSPQVENVSLE